MLYQTHSPIDYTLSSDISLIRLLSSVTQHHSPPFLVVFEAQMNNR